MVEAKTLTIADVLRGTTVGRMQSCGYMSVIPLISDLVDDRFVSPDKAKVSTTSYGTLIVENPEGSGNGGDVMILPFAAGYIVKQAAQDHATPTAKVIGSGKKVKITTAACIQQTQGGSISSGSHQFTIIPWSLREAALVTRKKEDYAKLWEPIGQFNRRLGITGSSHLEYFMEHFKDQLDEFAAEFEVVANQVGAIILMNGEVVGIERAPNYGYWKSIWGPMIRESYGSLALEYAKSFGDAPPAPKTKVPLKATGIRSLKELKVALERADGGEASSVKKVIRKLVDEPFTREVEEKVKGFSVETLMHKQFAGQVVKDDENVVYASFMTTGKWKKNQKWYEAEGFRI